MSIQNKEHATREFPMYIKYENNAQIKDYNEIHRHNAAEIIYITKGSAHILIDYNYFSASEGDVFFINANIAHSIIIKEPDQVEFFYFEYLPELIHTYGENQFNALYFLWLEFNLPYYYTVADQKLASLLESTYQISFKKKYGYEFALLANLLELNIWLFKKWEEETSISIPDISLPETQNLKDILNTIKTSYDTVSITALADSVAMSQTAFTKWFKNVANVPITEYLEQYKISQAKFYLISTSLSITEIALNVGFSSQTYFSKLFRSHTGISPTSFRKQHSAKHFFINTQRKATKPKINNIGKSKAEQNLYYKSIFLSLYYEIKTQQRKSYQKDFFEILFVDSGDLIIDYKNKFYSMNTGDITITAPNQAHTYYSSSESAGTLMLQFYPAILRFGMKKIYLEDVLSEITQKKFIPIKSDEKGYQNALQEFIALNNDRYLLDKHSEIRSRFRILRILAWILERKNETELHADSDEANNKATSIIKEILDYIDDNFTRNISLKDLAEKYDVNYSYLSRKFKEYTHTSFNKYINQKRIYRSTLLLATTNDSIAKIASDVGFCSQSRFTEIFIKRHLIPPKEYRKRLRSKAPLRPSFKKTYNHNRHF